LEPHQRLFTPQLVLDSPNSVLDFAGDLIALTFAFQLAVSSHLSGDFFEFALGLFGGTFNAIIVHTALLVAPTKANAAS